MCQGRARRPNPVPSGLPIRAQRASKIRARSANRYEHEARASEGITHLLARRAGILPHLLAQRANSQLKKPAMSSPAGSSGALLRLAWSERFPFHLISDGWIGVLIDPVYELFLSYCRDANNIVCDGSLFIMTALGRFWGRGRVREVVLRWIAAVFSHVEVSRKAVHVFRIQFHSGNV